MNGDLFALCLRCEQCSMSVSDLDSAEDTTASATNDAEEEEQDEEEDSPAESDVIEEEVDVHVRKIPYLFNLCKKKTAGNCTTLKV